MLNRSNRTTHLKICFVVGFSLIVKLAADKAKWTKWRKKKNKASWKCPAIASRGRVHNVALRSKTFRLTTTSLISRNHRHLLLSSIFVIIIFFRSALFPPSLSLLSAWVLAKALSRLARSSHVTRDSRPAVPCPLKRPVRGRAQHQTLV